MREIDLSITGVGGAADPDYIREIRVIVLKALPGSNPETLTSS